MVKTVDPAWEDVDVGLRSLVIEVAEREGAQAAARLIEAHWDRYVCSDPRQLLEVLRALPGEVFIDNPGMLVAANYLQQLLTQTAPNRFEFDPQLPVSPADAEGSLAAQLIVLTGTAAAERTRGNFANAKRAASEARRRLDEASAAEAGEVRANLPHLLVQWGRSYETAGMGGHLAHREYEEAHHLALLTDQPQIARRAASHLAWHLAERGRLNAAERWLRRAAGTGVTSPQYDAVLHLTAALLRVDRGERAGAAAELAQLAAYPLHDYWAAALWVRSAHVHTTAECTVLESDIVAAVERLPSSVSNGPINSQYLRAAWLRLNRLEETPRHETSPADSVLNAADAYRRGDFHDVIERAHRATAPEASPRSRAAALLLTAAAAAGLGRQGAATVEFAKARAIVERDRIYTTYQLIDQAHLRALSNNLGVPVPMVSGQISDGAADLLSRLSRREMQVLGLLTSKRSLPAIAGELFVSPNTLKTTVQRLYRKLGVNSRQGAADVAQRAGLHLSQ